MHLRSAAVALATLTLGGVIAASSGVAAQAAPTVAQAATADVATGTYYPVPIQRILDTRSGVGGTTGPVGGTVKEISVTVAGVAGVPATGASAVVLNLTGVAATAATYLTAYASGTTMPTVSNLNLVKSGTRANLVTVPIGADGKITLYNNAGSVHMLADVMGFYAGADIQGTHGIGSQYFQAWPERLFDSRTDGGALLPGEGVQLGVDWGPEDNANIRAVAVNITAISPTTAGYLAAWDGQGEPPDSSNVNFVKAQTVPNMAVVPTAVDGAGVPSFVVLNGPNSTTHVAVDIVGAYLVNQAEGLRYRSLTPRRIVDTRTGVGGFKGQIGSRVTKTFAPPAGVVGAETYALVGNTTAIAPTAATYLTVWDFGFPQPGISHANAAKGEIVANATVIDLGLDDADGKLKYHVYNNAGSINVAMDVSGAFDYYMVPAAGSAARLAPSSDGPRELAPVGVTARRLP